MSDVENIEYVINSIPAIWDLMRAIEAMTSALHISTMIGLGL